MSVVSPKEKLPDEEAQVDSGELSVTDAEGDSTLDPRQTPKAEETLRQPEFEVGWDGPGDPENPMVLATVHSPRTRILTFMASPGGLVSAGTTLC